MMTFIAPTPAIPSARQWCIRVTIPVRPPCIRTRVKSQSGRPLSSLVLTIFAASDLSSCSVPCLRVTLRMWFRMSKFRSSSQLGRPRSKGGNTTRWR